MQKPCAWVCCWTSWTSQARILLWQCFLGYRVSVLLDKLTYQASNLVWHVLLSRPLMRISMLL